jgi:hypothetical protein
VARPDGFALKTLYGYLADRSQLTSKTGETAVNHLWRIIPVMLIALGFMLSWCPTEAAFPTKAIELVVAFPAGGATDVMMRPLAAAVS